MSFWSFLAAELLHDGTFTLGAALVVTGVLVRAAAREERRRLLGMLGLFAIHVVLVPIAAAVKSADGTAYRDVRLLALVFGALSAVGMVSTVLFAVVMPRLHLAVPRIVRDVISAIASVVAIFSLASRVGINLSGILATSAILTAVIGLSLQDTLGNVVGGLALQLDNSIRVGDWVKIGDVSGKVTEIRWRYTALETRNWETLIVPNSAVIKQQVMILGRRGGQPLQWRRWVYFNVDFRYQPSDVIQIVDEALQGEPIKCVANAPLPNCILMDLHESYGRFAVRYWLTDLVADDPTDSVVRTRVFFALKRAGIPLSIPAHAIFLTEDSSERKAQKTQADLGRRLEALGRVDLFQNISAEERARLAESLHFAPFTRGETLCRQGSEGHWLYMISAGEVAVLVEVDGGLEREVARLSAGAFFGEMSLMTGERRSATVKARTDVASYRLDKTAFQEIIQRRPEIAGEIADVLARRRVELIAAKENLDAEAKARRLAAARSDLVGRIRDFFGLADEGKVAAG